MTTTRANIGITISVGNAAVQTLDDVAAILAEAASDLLTDRGSIRALDDRSMPLADANGNVVGWVQVTGFEVEADDDDESAEAEAERVNDAATSLGACPVCGSVNRTIRFGVSECSDCGASVALDSEAGDQ